MPAARHLAVVIPIDHIRQTRPTSYDPKWRDAYGDDIASVAQWLHSTSFPVDWVTNVPPPVKVLWALAHIMVEEDDVTLDEAVGVIEDETGWEL